MFTTDMLINAVDRKRVQLAASRGDIEPVSYAEIGREIGAHSSIFSRLKQGMLPSKDKVQAIVDWVGGESFVTCKECQEEKFESEPGVTTEDSFNDIDDLPDIDEEEPVENGEGGSADDEVGKVNQDVKAIFATGELSDSEDPETQAAVARVRELLTEGAVGVSVALDLHPDDSVILNEALEKAEKDGLENPIEDYLPEGFVPRQRIRHTAIVDTPAMADARLTIKEDGTLEGIVVFENEFTGDMRKIDAFSIDLEQSRTPSPIIWDRHDGDHSGATVGYLTSFERVDAAPTSQRAVLNDEAITASLKPMQFPASYFAQTAPTRPEPLVISAPDKKGYRAIRGLAAPKGVCHRSSMACWTWPGDMDSQHRNFHTGTLVGLDNGTDIRVGALTMGGAHLDPKLAKAGVAASSVGNHRDDANRVFALVRVWETRYGLMCAGVVPPDVTESDVVRALACSPSIEFWPEKGKRTLVGLHLVPTPALPVLASMGSAEIVVTDEKIELEEVPEELLENEEVEETEEAQINNLQVVEEKLDAIHEEIHTLMGTVNTILALIPVDDVDIPEE